MCSQVNFRKMQTITQYEYPDVELYMMESYDTIFKKKYDLFHFIDFIKEKIQLIDHMFRIAQVAKTLCFLTNDLDVKPSPSDKICERVAIIQVLYVNWQGKRT
jgi:hypothetical protein